MCIRDRVNIALLVLAVIAAVTQYIMTKQTAATNKPSKRFRDILADTAAGKAVSYTHLLFADHQIKLD